MIMFAKLLENLEILVKKSSIVLAIIIIISQEYKRRMTMRIIL
jgi:hypothetical protein